MVVGSPTQHVEVQATGLALQTEDPSFKQTIDQQTVTELPLNGRQVTSLITLSGTAAPTPVGNIGGNKVFYSFGGHFACRRPRQPNRLPSGWW